MYEINTNISGNSRLSDLIIHNHDVLSALEHFNIPLGVEDKTIFEIADEYKINPKAFEIVIRIYCKEIPVWNITEDEIPDLLEFLKTSHNHFKLIKIPELKKLIENFSKDIPLEHGKILVAFFDSYIKEVDEHFLYEDERVFPYVTNILKSANIKDFKIGEFEKNHTDIGQKLLDLKNILIKYIPSSVISESRRQILNKLMNLEQDLEYHTQLEDNILVPLVKNMETNIKKG